LSRNLDQAIFVAGHRGMVGSAIVRRLHALGYRNLVTAARSDLDLTDQTAVRAFFARQRIDHVVMAAAKVGGIHANNTYPAEFIAENLAVQVNVIDAAHRAGVQRLLFLGSSCIYPREAEQPMREEALLTGPLEPTNEPYAIAKIAGIKLCESYNRQYGRDYRSVMPTNLYGPGDNFHPQNSHVVPGLLRRLHEAAQSGAPEVVIWGSGKQRRDLLHVDDMAQASVFVMELDAAEHARSMPPTCSHINIGSGMDLSIGELAQAIALTTGFPGRLVFDSSKPDGAPRKLLDISKLGRLGWKPGIGLREGLAMTYRWYLSQHADRPAKTGGALN
jgi:GDP-L-fucose synthase